MRLSRKFKCKSPITYCRSRLCFQHQSAPQVQPPQPLGLCLALTAPAASPYCLPSPDGRFIATLLSSEIHIRSTGHLDEVAHVVALPPDLSLGALVSVQWSPSSRRVLVATSDLIIVAACLPNEDTATGLDQGEGEEVGSPFHAVIRNPTLPVVGKPAFVGFGSSDDQVCLCSAFGIKFATFDLRTAKTVEVANPKLHSPASVCSRGFSFRPASHHMALLTRTAGKDWVSIHDPSSAALVASWAPDTIDSQGLLWCPDGRWLAVWESPAHGHKIVFYTPDGHLFKTWAGSGSSNVSPVRGERDEQDTPISSAAPPPAVDDSLGSGVKQLQFSPDAHLLAVGDASRYIRIIDMASIVSIQKLSHPASLAPQPNTPFKIWQEQLNSSELSTSSDITHHFIEASRAVSPPSRSSLVSSGAAAASSGCSLLAFDSSSALLATRLEEAPSTVWIWNLKSFQLQAVLMFHANVSTAIWHSTLPQTVLITCDGDKHQGIGFVWSASCGPPDVVDFSCQFPLSSSASQAPGPQNVRNRPSWLNLAEQPLSLFYSDGKEFGLVSIDDNGDGAALSSRPNAIYPLLDGDQWADEHGRREESPLELVPAEADTEDASELEDTFLYKKDD